MTLDEALAEAYRSWVVTGFANVPEFDPADCDAEVLASRLSALEQVQDRCVVSKTQASWLRRVTT